MVLHKKWYVLCQQIKFFDTDDLKTLFERCLTLKNINKVACIKHDKDKREWTNWVEFKEPHFHFVLTFKNQTSSLTVANRLWVPENFIEPFHNTAKTNFLYLIHKNSPEKFQYDPRDVIANFDYLEYIDWALALQDINDIVLKIEKWDIKPYQVFECVNWLTYSKYKSRINNSIEHRMWNNDLLSKDNKTMECVFISGPSGCWKSTLSKLLAQKSGYNYYISSQWKNPFDNYLWEECIILDDLRDDIFSFAEFLKITDNNTSSLIGARYHNKSISTCKLLIVNTIDKIKDFYYYETCWDDDIKKQLYRRFKTYIVMNDEYIKRWNYDKLKNEYVEDFMTTNMISWMYSDKPIENSFIKNMKEVFSDRIIKDYLETSEASNSEASF